VRWHGQIYGSGPASLAAVLAARGYDKEQIMNPITLVGRALLAPIALYLTVASLGAPNIADAAPPAEAADAVFLNGKIVTVDAADSIAQAVAVRNGRILRVGTNAEVEKLKTPQTKVYDLHGKTALPGFIDGHAHPAIGLRTATRYFDGRIATTPSVATLL
jgi:hypothetical protein